MRRDDRGVSEILGGILLFALMLSLLVLVQMTVVPTLNQQVEYEQNQRVQDDVAETHASIFRVSGTGAPETVPIEVGVSYPNRAFLLNPPPASGSLRTGDPLSVTITNATATGEAGDYWTGDPVSYETTSLTYTPAYNEYRNAPVTVVEHSMVYNRYPDGVAILEDEGRLVSGRRITVVSLLGTVAEDTSGSATLNLEPVSAPMQTVSVQSTAANPLTLSVQTHLPESEWEAILDDEVAQGDVAAWAFQAGTAGAPNTVTVVMDPGTYDLRLGAVGVGGEYSRNADPAYVVVAEGNNSQLAPGETQRVIVQVRDAYNNPVSGVDVGTNLVAGIGTLQAVQDTTDENGQAVFVYEATGAGTETVELFYGSPGQNADPLTAVATITVVDPDANDPGDSVGGSINPSEEGKDVILVTSTRTGTSGEELTVTFNNTVAAARNVTDIRVNFYHQGSPGGSAGPRPTHYRLSWDGGSESTGIEVVGGNFVALDPDLSFAPGTGDLVFDWYVDGAGTPYGGTNSDDFVIVTLVFGDGDTRVYIVPSQT